MQQVVKVGCVKIIGDLFHHDFVPFFEKPKTQGLQSVTHLIFCLCAFHSYRWIVLISDGVIDHESDNAMAWINPIKASLTSHSFVLFVSFGISSAISVGYT